MSNFDFNQNINLNVNLPMFTIRNNKAIQNIKIYPL